jgi:hypothetical protein
MPSVSSALLCSGALSLMFFALRAILRCVLLTELGVAIQCVATEERSMALLINDDFASDVSGWTVNSGSVSHAASEGSDFSSGYASLAANSTIFKTFSAVASGKLRLDFWWNSATTTVGANKNILVYLLPDSTITSTNSGAVVVMQNDSAEGASTNEYQFEYRNSSGFQDSIDIRRADVWTKITIVLDITARTYDVYIDDVLYHQGVSSPNASFTSIDRVAIASQSSSPAVAFDNIRVASDWTLSESVLVDHTFVGGAGEIETLVPNTDTRNASPQKWLIPDTASGLRFHIGAQWRNTRCFVKMHCFGTMRRGRHY